MSFEQPPETKKNKVETFDIALKFKWNGKLLGPFQISTSLTVGELKYILFCETKVNCGRKLSFLCRIHELVLPKRQKLIGLYSEKKPVDDDTPLQELSLIFPKSPKVAPNNNNNSSVRENFKCMLVGTPEEEIPDTPDDLPDVFDDFDYDYIPSEKELLNFQNVKKKIVEMSKKDVTLIHPLRKGKKLLVLDLDYTVFGKTLEINPSWKGHVVYIKHYNFSNSRCSKQLSKKFCEFFPLLIFSQLQKTLDHKDYTTGSIPIQIRKRPYLDQFLAAVHPYYDICVWSQTSWRWLEMKCTEMGMLTNPHFHISFVLDKTFMFRVTSQKQGEEHQHHVKPLQIIWNIFPEYFSEKNTIHIDDLNRNFACNPRNGLKIKAYRDCVKSTNTDTELQDLAKYLVKIADFDDISTINHTNWKKQL